MTDIVQRLRDHDRHIRGRLIEGLTDLVIDDMVESADEIERLRETIRQADCVLQLLAPENHCQTTDAEMASLLSSISEKLSRMVEEWDRAALGEKE